MLRLPTEFNDALRTWLRGGFRPLLRIGCLWHLTSLDAATVAVVWALGFAWAVQVRLPVWVLMALALATWVVYIGDRLLDARRALQKGRIHELRERHRFHWRHRRVFVPIAMSAAGLAASLVFARMPTIAVERNSVLAGVTLAYFAGVHGPFAKSHSWIERRLARLRQLISAELLVALLFTAGCALPAFSRATRLTGLAFAGIAVYFALVAWLNCFAIQRWESVRSGFGVRISALLVSGAGLVFAWAMWRFETRIAFLAVAGATGALLLAALDRVGSRLSPLVLRACADAVLLTPLALLLR